MATVEELLAPVSESSPCGENVRYTTGFDKLKETRRQSGDWLSEGGSVDYLQVTKLCEDILLKKSKDLQVAVWLVEALLARQGFAGFRSGVSLIHGLIETYWEGLFPELEDGDAGLRLAPLDWMGSYLDLPLKSVPINKDGHSLISYKESQMVGMPPDPEKQYDDPEWDSKKRSYDQAVADGKMGGDVFEAGFKKSSKEYYVKLVDELTGIIEALDALQALSEQKFTDEPPSFSKIRTALDEILITANGLLERKRELEPDAVAETEQEEETSAGEGEETSEETVTVARVKKKVRRAVGGIEPESIEEIGDRLSAIATFLRTQNPQDPGAYLLLRGYRWGELRASGSTAPDQTLLEAPQTEIRTQIKKLSLEGNWEELVRVGEEAMATPAGRGWLDLQRYIVTACENLYYAAAGTAICSAMKSLLLDMPELLNMTLMDDTPVANTETQNWIKTYILPPPPPEPEPVATESAPPEQYMPAYEYSPVQESAQSSEDGHHEERQPDAFDLAQEALRNGNRDQAIEILVRELGQERSGRARFHRKMQLAQICLSIGKNVVARPILEELTAEIEKRRLDEWEPSESVAHTLALLYRCMEGDAERKQQIYSWICRLDPVQALACLK